MKRNSLIERKQQECAKNGHGRLIKDPRGGKQCILCGKRFQPGEYPGKEQDERGGGRFTEQELEACKEAKKR